MSNSSKQISAIAGALISLWKVSSLLGLKVRLFKLFVLVVAAEFLISSLTWVPPSATSGGYLTITAPGVDAVVVVVAGVVMSVFVLVDVIDGQLRRRSRERLLMLAAAPDCPAEIRTAILEDKK